MASIIKVDQIQSDTGTVNVASKIEFPVGSAAAPSIFPTGDTNTGIFFPAADTIAFAEGGAEAMRIDSSGNVGIGTSSPTSSWKATIQNTATIGAGIDLKDSGGTSRAQVGLGAAGTGSSAQDLYINANSNLLFNTAATERARIDSSGRLLVNNTETDKGMLTVYNNAATFSSIQAFAYFKGTQSGDVGMPGLFIAKYDNDSTTSQLLVRFAINNAVNGQGQINGNGAGAAAFGSYSDARLKENIVDLPSQIDNICALRPVEFDYIESEGGGHQIGFVAQDIQQVYPDTVSEREPDGMLTITGWSKTEARLVKAIQELKAITDAQASRIETLEAKVAALEAK